MTCEIGTTIDLLYPHAFSKRGPNFGAPLNIDALFSRVESDLLWQIDSHADSSPIPFDDYQIVGLPKAEEAMNFTNDPISRELLRSNPDRRDIVVVTVRCQHGAYHPETWIREITLLAVDFENIGDKPIGLSSLTQAAGESSVLYHARTSVEDERVRSRATPKEVSLPLEALRPRYRYESNSELPVRYRDAQA